MANKVKFHSKGFRAVLFSQGVSDRLHAIAAQQRAALESDGSPRELASVGRTRAAWLIKGGERTREG